jgi:predicted unusual protein kinase regulating ubiquinone biosynthesis (AarF/ABC1/UbiB family)
VLSLLYLLQVQSRILQITNIQQLSAVGLDTAAVARRATEAYLLQILRHGFLHAGAPFK